MPIKLRVKYIVFEYIQGILVEISPHRAVVDVHGIGYLLHIPLSSFSASPPVGEKVLFYISSVIREDSHRNFAFLSREERDLFEKISNISGIGPKTALALVGYCDNIDLKGAITTANTTLLSKVPGIGKKTAERLVVELRDTLFKGDETSCNLSNIHAPPEEVVASDAIKALINLGYNTLQAQRAVKRALTHYEAPPPIEDLIKTALSGL